jgi:prepilin-type processing-associated H-X9-DG protein
MTTLGQWFQAGQHGGLVSVLAQILPYIEADNVRKQMAWNENLATGGYNGDTPWYNYNVPAGQVTSNRVAANARIKAFLCPSDDLVSATPSWGVIAALYWAYDGSTPNWWVAEPWVILHGFAPSALTTGWGRTNYVACSGGSGIAANTTNARNSPFAIYEGIFSNRSQITLGQLTAQDGTSNTLFFGETLGRRGIGSADTVIPWACAAVMATGAGLGRSTIDNEFLSNDWNPNGTNNYGAAVWRFSARHAAGVQFAWGDGSVRTVRYGNTKPPASNVGVNGNPPGLTHDYMLLMQLAGRKDGLNLDVASLTE